MTSLALATLEAVRQAGGEVKLVGRDRLKVVAPAPLPDGLVNQVRTLKAELVELLAPTGQPPASIIHQQEEDRADAEGDWQERAAIVEFDASIPRQWAEGFAKLCTMPRPLAFSQRRWARIVNDAGHFIDRWAHTVAMLGWTTEEIFGVDPTAPEACQFGRGLVSLIRRPTRY
jgi:hypothetical protein